MLVLPFHQIRKGSENQEAWTWLNCTTFNVSCYLKVTIFSYLLKHVYIYCFISSQMKTNTTHFQTHITKTDNRSSTSNSLSITLTYHFQSLNLSFTPNSLRFLNIIVFYFIINMAFAKQDPPVISSSMLPMSGQPPLGTFGILRCSPWYFKSFRGRAVIMTRIHAKQSPSKPRERENFWLCSIGI